MATDTNLNNELHIPKAAGGMSIRLSSMHSYRWTEQYFQEQWMLVTYLAIQVLLAFKCSYLKGYFPKTSLIFCSFILIYKFIQFLYTHS